MQCMLIYLLDKFAEATSSLAEMSVSPSRTSSQKHHTFKARPQVLITPWNCIKLLLYLWHAHTIFIFLPAPHTRSALVVKSVSCHNCRAIKTWSWHCIQIWITDCASLLHTRPTSNPSQETGGRGWRCADIERPSYYRVAIETFPTFSYPTYS